MKIFIVWYGDGSIVDLFECLGHLVVVVVAPHPVEASVAEYGTHDGVEEKVVEEEGDKDGGQP